MSNAWLTRFRERDNVPGVFILQDFAHQQIINRMTWLFADITTDYRCTDQCKIANRIKNFVTDKLVFHAQAFRVQNFVIFNGRELLRKVSCSPQPQRTRPTTKPPPERARFEAGRRQRARALKKSKLLVPAPANAADAEAAA